MPRKAQPRVQTPGTQAWRGQARRVTDWWRERSGEMAERKGRQQWETEGTLQGHSCLMPTARVLAPCWNHTHIRVFESRQFEGSCVGDCRARSHAQTFTNSHSHTHTQRHPRTLSCICTHSHTYTQHMYLGRHMHSHKCTQTHSHTYLIHSPTCMYSHTFVHIQLSFF